MSLNHLYRVLKSSLEKQVEKQYLGKIKSKSIHFVITLTHFVPYDMCLLNFAALH